MWNLRLLFIVGLTAAFISEKFFVSSQSPFPVGDDLYLEGQASGDRVGGEDGKDDGLPLDDEDAEGSGSGSGSGDDTDVTDEKERLLKFFNISSTVEEVAPSQPQPTADSPPDPATSQDPATTVQDIEFIPFPEGDSRNKVASVDPTTDWFTHATSHVTVPPSESTTTESTVDNGVNHDTDEDNSLYGWNEAAPENAGDMVPEEEIDNEIVAIDGKGSRIFEMESPNDVTSENLWERREVLAAVIACGAVGFLCAVFLLVLLAYRMKKKDEGSYDLGDTKLSTTQYHKTPTKEFYA
ncbi:syndecan-1-like [Brachionichthys hirsutus]|uniref:syndecan-1-like n=1 Tax=Brachionichthys hirsutus TaxID=412623 RepID=UPI003604C830